MPFGLLLYPQLLAQGHRQPVFVHWPLSKQVHIMNQRVPGSIEMSEAQNPQIIWARVEFIPKMTNGGERENNLDHGELGFSMRGKGVTSVRLIRLRIFIITNRN